MRKIFAICAMICSALSLTAQTSYGLSVGGYPVTSANADDVMGDGLISYDASTKTLTFAEGACINTKANEGIYNTGSALVIQLNGNNEIICSGTGSVIRSHKNLTIKGKVSDITNQRLKLEGAMQGIYMKEGAALRIEDCSVEVASTNYNICGDSTEKLTVSYSFVKTSDAKLMSVGDFALTSYVGVAIGEVADARNATTIAPTDKQVPTLPTVSAITSTDLDYQTVVLNWGATTDNNTNQAQLYYHLSYRKANDDDWTSVEPAYNMQTATLSGLEESTKYTVRLQVTDRSGNTAEYPEAEFTTQVNPDGISSVKAHEDASGTTYDLTGRKINRNASRGQITIRNGKKTL